MNYEDIMAEEEENFVPISLEYENIHDSSKCVFCNINSGLYMKPRNAALKKIFKDIDLYSRTGNEALILRIIQFYDTVIRKPCNKLILSGKCRHGLKLYPEITENTIKNHIKTFSYSNIKIEKIKELTQLSRELAKNHLIGSNSDGRRIVDEKKIALYLNVVDRLYKFTSLNVKKIK